MNGFIITSDEIYFSPASMHRRKLTLISEIFIFAKLTSIKLDAFFFINIYILKLLFNYLRKIKFNTKTIDFSTTY